MPQLLKQEGPESKEEQTYLLKSGKPGSGDSDTESYCLNTLPSKASVPIELYISFNGAKTTMKLDNGASHPIISERMYRKLIMPIQLSINILPLIYRYILKNG